MNKVIFLIVFIFMGFLSADDFGSRFAYPVQKVENDHVYINYTVLEKGESGYILRWFDPDHAAIVARVAVEGVENNETKLIFKPFNGVKNDAFPTAELTPKRGDEVLLRDHYDRALLIAPSQELYRKIVDTYKNTNWTHPDLFASELVKHGTIRPTRNDFRDFCNAYAVGLVYFINGTRGELRDCMSFAVLKTDYISGLAPKNERMKPFFSRIGNIDAGWLDFLNSDIGDFYSYYRYLLDKKEDTNEQKSLLDSIMDFWE